MHRVRVAVSAALLLAASILAAPTPAGAAWPTNGACDIASQGHYFGGLYGDQGVAPHVGIKAKIYTDSARFQQCTGPLGQNAGGVLQWVALDWSGDSSGDNIAQVGILKCGGGPLPTGNAACDNHPGQLIAFWALGGSTTGRCGFAEKTPDVQYLATITTAEWATFIVIYRNDVDNFYFYFVSPANGTFSVVKDASTYCWENSPYEHLDYAVERWDPNDGFGGPGPASFDATQYNESSPYSDSAWQPSTWASTSDCYLWPEFNCSRTNSQHFGFWTVNQ